VSERARRIGFIGVAAYMLLSPAYVQVFGGRDDVVRAWRMYHKRGLGICSAVYYEGDRRIDRYALFGETRATAPVSFRRITDEREARAMAARICRARGKGADVRVTLRCGVPEGLTTLLDREENLCRG
jgi:hypothetical protein